ncbi:hypothetical protein BCR43DRAFT_488658 [Syncephalastrum racemosum]|uniref:VanZ-like domain-containing protein n=1 Tax=Syncephalastrum racemosum TaxID=13706 RepID=A0A1X2HJ47_SYNRA|nr:hypothetical protein BCR43DRAFT_488658 [Syncephalastrum racemosum]
MRLRILVALFFLLIVFGVLGFAPVHLHEAVNDKALHFGAFFVLAVCLYFLWNLSYKRNLVLASVILFSIAVLSEFIQGLLPYRTFDGYDIVANIVGGTLGLLVAFGLDYLIATRRDHRRRWGGKREAEYQRALMEETDLDDFHDDPDDEERLLVRS